MTTQDIELLATDIFQILHHLESSIEHLEDLLSIENSVSVITVNNEEDNIENDGKVLNSSLNVEACVEAQKTRQRSIFKSVRATEQNKQHL